jgi:hypothetical protein
VVREVLAEYFALTHGERQEHAQVRPKVDISS